MSETTLLETVGRKQIQLEAQDAAYSSLLNLLVGVVSGVIDPSRVLVNVTDRTWTVAEPGQRPALPATVNGLPLCVVAPPDPVEEGLAAIRAHHATSAGVTETKAAV